MSRAWFVIPSARPVDEVRPVVAKWLEMGYGVALQRDGIGNEVMPVFGCSELYVRPYRGYAEAVNYLAMRVLNRHPEVDWVVAAGDDTFPDPNKTGDEIAAELRQHFRWEAWKWFELRSSHTSPEHLDEIATFGCCQPVGDDWYDNLGKIILRIAGSPWLGREWCRRAHAGKGPLWPEFTHMFGDEALQLYAQSLGVFLQRPDLTHYHAHAQREPGGNVSSDTRKPAPHMTEWNSQKHWQESKAIFERLKSTNFAECQPIP